MKELGTELCSYCSLPEQAKGVHNYGKGPVMCFDSGLCDEAYENYKEEYEGCEEDE